MDYSFFKKIKRYSLKERKSKVELSFHGKAYERGSLFTDFIDTLPDILGAKELKAAAMAIVMARQAHRPVILGMGAHPIKTGLSPIIIDLMESSIITGLATNGASTVHDFELAYGGATSEEVGEHLSSGLFGMALETGVYLNDAIKEGVKKGFGLGRSVGGFIQMDDRFPYKDMSIFAASYRVSIPLTVHVAIGTDIIHMHPEADGASIGEGSLRDFYTLTEEVCKLEGGVFINLGSAVIIPEVFLKAINLARNTGHTVERFTAINMDFIKQYRAQVNVLHRPTGGGGRAINLTGHHEIMFPLLAALVKEQLYLNKNGLQK
ncbi:MAG: hypothetical protein L3V56_11310 [Candidatus Magnetoovum sp. WYHC-5]|nr:hypothetical protein [Candidatus Magnetoovum sp. WYHC-5]